MAYPPSVWHPQAVYVTPGWQTCDSCDMFARDAIRSTQLDEPSTAQSVHCVQQYAAATYLASVGLMCIFLQQAPSVTA